MLLMQMYDLHIFSSLYFHSYEETMMMMKIPFFLNKLVTNSTKTANSFLKCGTYEKQVLGWFTIDIFECVLNCRAVSLSTIFTTAVELKFQVHWDAEFSIAATISLRLCQHHHNARIQPIYVLEILCLPFSYMRFGRAVWRRETRAHISQMNEKNKKKKKKTITVFARHKLTFHAKRLNTYVCCSTNCEKPVKFLFLRHPIHHSRS